MQQVKGTQCCVSLTQDEMPPLHRGVPPAPVPAPAPSPQEGKLYQEAKGVSLGLARGLEPGTWVVLRNSPQAGFRS